MAANVLVGLAVTAHNNLQTNTSTFDNVSVACQLLPAPASLTATLSDLHVALQWSPVAGAETYNLKGSTTDNGPYTIIAAGLSGTNYLDLAPAYGATSYYVVSAVNVNGEGANSPQASVTLHDPPQLAVNVSPDGSQLVVAWPGWATNYNLWAATNLAPPVVWSP